MAEHQEMVGVGQDVQFRLRARVPHPLDVLFDIVRRHAIVAAAGQDEHRAVPKLSRVGHGENPLLVEDRREKRQRSEIRSPRRRQLANRKTAVGKSDEVDTPAIHGCNTGCGLERPVEAGGALGTAPIAQTVARGDKDASCPVREVRQDPEVDLEVAAAAVKENQDRARLGTVQRRRDIDERMALLIR